MTASLLLGAGLGLGLLLVQRGLLPRRPGLAEALARLDRPGRDEVTAPASSWRAALERRAAGWIAAAGVDLGRLGPDLRLLERTPQQHAAAKLLGAVCGLSAPLAVSALAAVLGSHLPAGAVLVSAVAGAPLGFVLPDRRLRARAATRRSSFRHALASYLDLVTILLAGGGHSETALTVAARTGDGWSFMQLRRALEFSRVHRESPWVSLHRLGDELGVAELRELAASVQLAGSQGARTATSLAAKAATLRAHQLADSEAQAEAATERMTVPTTALVIGFVGFLLYPAVVRIAGLT